MEARASTTSRRPAASRKRRRKGISPWVPNQHGAWAMLISPAVLGLIAGIVTWVREPLPGWQPAIVLPAVLIAWFFGYFAFFAFGLVAKARTPERRAQYITPVYVYGGISLAGIVVALLLQPALLWWAIPFAPLVVIAVWETLQGRPRSTVSGVSTTVASALLFPALVMVGQGIGATTPLALPSFAWLSMAFLALYFTGTIPFVKTMIREKNNPRYLFGSIAYHVAAALAVSVLVIAWRPGLVAAGLMLATMLVALARACYIPWSAKQGQPWSARRVGMAEMPILLLACGAVLAAVL